MQSKLVYVEIGLAELPVFTQGGGVGYFLQPPFGYLIDYIAGAFVVGWIIERIDNPKTYQFISCQFGGITSRILNWRSLPLLAECMDRGFQAAGPMFG